MIIRINRYHLPDGKHWWKYAISRSTRGNLILRIFHINIWLIKESTLPNYRERDTMPNVNRRPTMSGTSKGAKKFAKKKIAEDPDYFKNLQKKAKRPRGGKASPGSFKKGNKYAAKGGKAGKRGPGKVTAAKDVDLGDGVKLDFIETDGK